MKLTVITVAIALAVGFACSGEKNSDAETSAANSSTKNAKKMANLISIVEIPTDSLQRATQFYQSILNISIEVIDMQGTQMGIFPGVEGSVNVALIHGSDYKPSDRGTLAYLNAGEDLQPMLARVEANGGKVVVPKTEIDAENGFFAMFIDSEGNKLGLHSRN